MLYKWLKQIIKRMSIYAIIKEKSEKRKLQNSETQFRLEQQNAYDNWIKSGQPVPPPPLYKQSVIAEYANKHNVPVFIETGTFLGHTVAMVHDIFREAYTIELGTALYIRAAKALANKGNIICLHGDSNNVLRELLPTVDNPCLFWLDAHYSEGITARGEKDTPIMEELDTISKHSYKIQDVILIDDARCFGAEEYHSYPSIDWVKDWAQKEGFDSLTVENDIIRICNIHKR